MLRTLSPLADSPLLRDPFFRAMDQLLEAPLRTTNRTRPAGPRVNGYRTDEAWHLVFELPGFTADQLEVKVEDGGLTVAGQHQRSAPEGARPLRRERSEDLGFERRFDFPEDALLDEVEATLDRGLLTLTVPRRTPTVRRIEVKAG